MKRSNFTFLFLFALLGFSFSNAHAQSVACINRVNVSIASDCSWTIQRADVTSRNDVDSIWVYPETPGGGPSAGLSFAAASALDTFPGTWSAGVYRYNLYTATGAFVCWGSIQLERKALPTDWTSTDTTDCVWYEKGRGWPTRNVLDSLANGCYAIPVGDVRYSETTLTTTDPRCDTVGYVRVGVMNFNVEGRITPLVISRDTLYVTPLTAADICLPPVWIDVDCDILPADYNYDANNPADHAAISSLLSPNVLKSYYAKKGNRSPDSLVAPYLKKPGTIYYDSVFYCTHWQKAQNGTEQVQVLSKDGELIWTIVPRYEFRCVRDTAVEVLAGTWACAEDKPDLITIDTVLSGPTPMLMHTTGTGDYCRVEKNARDTFGIDRVALEKGRLCNITVKCVDWVTQGDCKNLPLIMREWDVIDFCNDHSVMDTTQWIRVNDSEAPKWSRSFARKLASGYRVSVSIAPWTCAAEYTFTPPATDWDKDFVAEYTLTDANGSPAGYVVMGDDGRTATFRGLLKEACPITVNVVLRDWCGNATAGDQFHIDLQDNVAPVALTHDEINVVLTGDSGNSTGDVGVAKARVESFDNGSHDAGCGYISRCVLLKEELENPVYIAAGNWWSKTADGKGAKFADPDEYPGGYFTEGYVPVQCGDPDDVFYEWSRDKFGKFTLIGTHHVIYCKDFVKFCCDDLYVATGEFKQVALVVEDAAGETCQSTSNNKSYGWTNVRVEDKSASSGWYCRPASVKCTELSTFTPPTPSYGGVYCNAFDVEKVSERYDEECGEGTYFVEWVAKRRSDGVEVGRTTCEYPITGGKEFDPHTIKWPKHYTGDSYAGINLECRTDDKGKPYIWSREKSGIAMGDPFECSTGDIMDAPVWCSEDCSLIVPGSEDLPLPGEAACGKIIRRWTIIDWCKWKPNGNNVDDENDTYQEEFEAVEDWTKGADCEACQFNGDYDNVYFRYKKGKVDVDGYYTFDQVIKTLDKTAPIITSEDATFDITGGNDTKDGTDFSGCTVPVTVSISVVDSCATVATEAGITTKWSLQGTKLGGFGTTADLGVLSAGTYVVAWNSQDACGNNTQALQKVTVADNKKPTPVCLKDISTATMNVEGSSVAIWAKDFELGSFDNCTPYADLQFYFKDADGNEVPSLEFTCDDMPNGVSQTMSLQMYVADANGNEDFCSVTLRIDDNNDICTGDSSATGASIRGEVRTAIGDMIESAEVALNKANTDMTGVTGKYSFGELAANNTYELTSTKSDDYINGVSAQDLVLIQKHLLGIAALNDPYKVIAADINGDNKVSSKDLAELRKLILGVYAELPNNASWRFVDANQTFEDVNNPFPFTETVNLRISDDQTNQDFIGTKIGDVSGNAIANSLIAAGTRSAGTLNLEMGEKAFAAGEVFSVDVAAANFSDIAALQFTMNVAGLELISAESGALAVSADNFAQLDASTITTVWHNTAGVSADDVLFTMTFRATEAGQLSSALAITSGITSAEAYTAGADVLDVAVAFNSAAGEFALMQNEPNPFSATTTIAFQLAEAGAATLTVFDVTGKTISVVRGEYAKGMNQITLSKSDLGTSGILYYQLESGEYTATKKMVIIE